MTGSGETHTGWDTHMSEEVCLDLVFGLLPAPEEAGLLEHAGQCLACETILRRVSADVEETRASFLLERSADGQLVLRAVTPSLEVVPEPTARPRERRAPQWLADSLRNLVRRPALGAGLALATAAVAVLVLWPGSNAPLDSIAPIPPLPGLGEEVRRRAGDSAQKDQSLSQGIEAYERGDLDAAILHLESAKVEGSWDALRRCYLGSALAREGRFAEAIETLEPVTGSMVPDPWGSEARWALYVSYRAEGMKDRADSLFRVIAQEPGSVGDRARDEVRMRGKSR